VTIGSQKKEDVIISITDKELISKIIKYKWYQINESLNDKYWENFNNQKKSEN
jgi:hypothetical protein